MRRTAGVTTAKPKRQEVAASTVVLLSQKEGMAARSLRALAVGFHTRIACLENTIDGVLSGEVAKGFQSLAIV